MTPPGYAIRASVCGVEPCLSKSHTVWTLTRSAIAVNRLIEEWQQPDPKATQPIIVEEVAGKANRPISTWCGTIGRAWGLSSDPK